nr:uncharacterized protein LOC128689649 [Cherax quadricarinatus]
MKAVLALLLVMAAGILAQDTPNMSYDVHIDNSQPPAQSIGSILHYGPPPAGGTSFQYGPPPLPPPQSNDLGLMYGPQSPSPSVGYKKKLHSYENALSLFDDECGYWKSLSVILLVSLGVTSLGLLLKTWPLQKNLFGSEDAVNMLKDPEFVASVQDKINDISRILASLKESSENDIEE